MTAPMLSLLILVALLSQVAAFGFFGWRRRHREFVALGRSSEQATSPTARGMNASPGKAAWDGLREFVVRERVIEDRKASVCSFYLEPTDGATLPQFIPGQYLTFALDLPKPDGGGSRRVTRCYSLSDRPHAPHYRVTIKRVPAPADRQDLPAGRVSNYFHDEVEVGTRLMVKAPEGRFHLHEDTSRPLVLIGGGIGITPMLSMLNETLHASPEREVWLFYGVRNGNEHVMKDHLQALQSRHPHFHLNVCYSAPDAGDRVGIDYHHSGRIDVSLLRNTLRLAPYQYYVCGPGAMMEALIPALEDWGVAPEDVFYETFGPSTLKRRQAPKVAGDTAGQVTFSRSNKTVPWDPEAGSLLAFAEDHGVEVESGCRSGSCGGCQTRIERGEVLYPDEPSAEIADGHCLLCVGIPSGNVTLNA